MNVFWIYFIATVFVRTVCGVKSTITKAETISNTTLGKGLVFVRVTLDDGTVGIGQCGTPWKHTNSDLWMTEIFHDIIAPIAVGSDANDLATIEQHIWEKNYKSSGEMFFRTLAGLDSAVFDALAKQANLSVCNFLRQKLRLSETPCPTTFPIYGSSMSRTVKPNDLVKKLIKLRDDHGVTAFKIKIAQRMGHNIDVYPNRSEEVVAAARSALGPDIRLMVDANSGYTDIAHAGPIAQMLLKYNVSWFEEPCVWNNLQCAQQVNNLNLVPVALGEQEYRLYEDWRSMLNIKNYDLDIFGGSWEKLSKSFFHKQVNKPTVTQIAQPDVGYVGGITRALQVAAWASSSGIQFCPHNPGATMNLIFVLHLMASLPSSVAVPWVEFGCVDNGIPKGIWKPEIVLKNGRINVPQTPGWGVTLDPIAFVSGHHRSTP